MKNLEKQFVTYKIAEKLKELGFNEPCLANYSVRKNIVDLFEFRICKNQDNASFLSNAVLAPLWQQAIDYINELLCENGKTTRIYYCNNIQAEIDILKYIELIKNK